METLPVTFSDVWSFYNMVESTNRYKEVDDMITLALKHEGWNENQISCIMAKSYELNHSCYDSYISGCKDLSDFAKSFKEIQ